MLSKKNILRLSGFCYHKRYKKGVGLNFSGAVARGAMLVTTAVAQA